MDSEVHPPTSPSSQRSTPFVPPNIEDVTELDGPRYLLLTDLIGHPQKSMCVSEFEFMNPTLSKGSIRYHLDWLCDEGVLQRSKLSSENRASKFPYTFFSLTAAGEDLISSTGLEDRIPVFEELYHIVLKTDRILQIEEMPRPDQ